MRHGAGDVQVGVAKGVVAAPHGLAAEAGATALRNGGNALDAAVAAAITIAVVYPHMTGIGGDSFWLIFDGRTGTLQALDAAGRSAAGVDVPRYRAAGAIPTRGGGAAFMVPGAVSGWSEVHHFSRERLDSPVAWAGLFEDAIRHARDGFPVSAGQRRVTAQAAALFAGDAPAEVRATFHPVFHPRRFGEERFTQPALAATLREVAEGGAEAFYRGALARRLADGAAAVGSPLTAADLAAHEARWVEPLRIGYRRGEAASFPPPTQGMTALAILKLLEGFDLAAADDATLVHLTVEATKLAFEDRDRYLADPTVVEVPVARCLDAERLAARRAGIGMRATPPGAGGTAGGDTIAIVAADRDGNAVCVIQSLYHEFGAAVVAGDTGVLLQNRGAFFSLDPAHPNHLAPRKKTAHTLIPSMYLEDGRPRCVYGTMGGEGQPQTQAALVARMVDRGLGPQAAIDAPRWLYGRTWGDASRTLKLEARFGDRVVRALRERGHEVEVLEDWSDLVGHAQAIAIEDGRLRAGSDPRADGAALSA